MFAAKTGKTARGWRDEARATSLLAGPLVLDNLAHIAITTTDILFIGRLGALALGASALGNGIFVFFAVIGVGLVTAASPLIANELGAKAHSVRDVRRTVRMAIWLAMLVSIPMAMLLAFADRAMLAAGQNADMVRLSYPFLIALIPCIPAWMITVVLRSFVSALGRPHIALWISLFGVAMNAFLNWLLIFGHWGFPAMGLIGSGIASSITNWTMAAIFVAVVMTHRRFSRYHLFGRWWRYDGARMADILRIGAPIAVTLGFEVGVFAAAIFLMGKIGPVAAAAHAVVIQLASISFMVPMGLGQAATIRVGLAYGAGDRGAMHRAGLTALVMGQAFMALAAGAMLLFPDQLLGLFIERQDPLAGQVMQAATGLLFVCAIFQLADGAQVVGAGMLRGIKDTKVPMLYAAFGYWVVGIGVGAWLAFNRGWGGVGIWTGLALGLTIVAVLMLWRWHRREQFWDPPAPLRGEGDGRIAAP